MKLASLRTGGSRRDGELLVVSRDLTRAALATDIAETLQAALDDWPQKSVRLDEAFLQLDQDPHAGFPLDTAQLAAPLPRAYQWLDGSAYVHHVELVRKARGAELPESFWTDPLMYQGGSDPLLGPRDDIVVADTDWGIDFEAEVAVVTTDVAAGATAREAGSAIALFMLVNDVSLRNLIPAELAKGFGFVHGKPPTAFSPVAVTADELGDAWRDGKLHRPLEVEWNGESFGAPDAGVDMTFNFLALVAHAAKTRPLRPGTIVGSGTVSNVDRTKGSCCIAEQRMLETLEAGEPSTAFMNFGDRVKIEMRDVAGRSIFGAIDQTVVSAA